MDLLTAFRVCLVVLVLLMGPRGSCPCKLSPHNAFPLGNREEGMRMR